MKKIILTAPLTLLLGMLNFTANLEAAGCSSHKNKNVQVECSLSENNCDSKNSDTSSKKVEA